MKTLPMFHTASDRQLMSLIYLMYVLIDLGVTRPRAREIIHRDIVTEAWKRYMDYCTTAIMED